MNEEQRRADATLTQYLQKWQSYNASQKNSPDGMELRGNIHALVRVRNGGDAADEVLKRIQTGKNVTTDMIDDLFPRIDGDEPKPQTDDNEAPTEKPSPSPHSPADVYAAAPGDGRKWLPSNETLPKLSADDESALNATDAQIEEINRTDFHVDPALAWKPSGAELPSTGTNISTLGDTYTAAQKALPKLQAAADKLSAAFGSSGEQLIDNQHARIKSALRSMTDAVGASKGLDGMVANCGVAANDAFHHQLRGSDLAARDAIGTAIKAMYVRTRLDAGRIGLPRDVPDEYLSRYVTSSGEFANLSQALQTGAPAPTVESEASKIHHLAETITAPAAVSREHVGTDEGKEEKKKEKSTSPAATSPDKSPSGPKPTTPSSVPGSSPGSSPGKSSPKNANDLSKLLSQLGQAAAPMAGIPQQAAAVPQQAAQAAQQAAKPLTDAANDMQKVPQSLMDALKGKTPENEKSNAVPKNDAADADRRAATSPTFTKPGQANPDKLGTPGSPARPNQLDAEGKPADKDRDGKVDKDAKPLAKSTVKPFNLKLDPHGQHAEVKDVPDPRIGEMMLNMADATADSPVSVLDAAGGAGMDIESLGDPVDPAQAKVGDAVIGDEESGLYIGDGQVLTSTGDIESIEDVTGETGFVSEVPLPELPDDVPAPEPAPEPPSEQAPA
ncbi:hypothetical protein, partial [Mycolicibacillus koreensis]